MTGLEAPQSGAFGAGGARAEAEILRRRLAAPEPGGSPETLAPERKSCVAALRQRSGGTLSGAFGAGAENFRLRGAEEPPAAALAPPQGKFPAVAAERRP